MKSPVWVGDWPITQVWGPTTLTVEPWYRSGTTLTHWHCGIDIGMPSGTPLYAARAGIVSRNGWGLLGVRVGNNQTDYYIHIDSSVVVLGEVVKQHQLVAYSGNKVPSGGTTTGPHLHFEVNAAGLNVPPGVDPVPILTAVYSGGGGSIVTPDVTDDQALQLKNTSDKVNALWDLVCNGALVAGRKHWINDELEALKKAVAAVPVSTGTTDQSALFNAVVAIQGSLAGISSDLAAARSVLDKIDRGE